MLKKLIKSDINPGEWEFEFQQRNKQTILMADWWCRAVYHHLSAEMKIDLPSLDYLMTGSSRGYVKKDQKRKIIELLTAACQKDDYLDYVMRQTMARFSELAVLAKELETVIENDKVSNARLAEIWKKMDSALIRIICWFWIPWYVSEYNILTDRVRVGLNRNKDKIKKIADDTTTLMSVIFPTKLAAFQEEQLDFYKLVRLAETDKQFPDNKVFRQKAKEYLKKYDWIVTYPFLLIPPLTYERLMANVHQAIKDKSIIEFQRQQGEKKKNKKLAQSIIKMVRGDVRLIRDIKWTRELGYVLTASVEEATRSIVKFQDFFRFVASRLSIRGEELGYFVSGEILGWLSNKQTADSALLEKRKQGYVLAVLGGIEMIAFGQEAVDFTRLIDDAIAHSGENIEELKGQTANYGQVSGIVRVASTPQDSYNLKEREVLVCSMTGPDYVPAMKRAAAIITDEGGLLSHAAIMSREFGKPCVIATKIATKILKDGDLVEVDANKGLVKILKRNK